MAGLIVWLRSGVFVGSFTAAVTLYGVLCVIVLPCLPLGRRFRIAIQINRFTMWWFRIVCGVHYEIEGREHLPKGSAVVLVSNHQSEWETFYLQTLVSPLCTVLKKELLRIPIFGWSLALIKPIAIDRSLRTGALRQIVDQGKAKLRENFSVLIFPEGTRVPYGQRKKFSKTAAYLACEAGVPVVPVVHNAGACWPAKGFIKHPGSIRVIIGPAITSEGKKVDELHEQVSGWMDAHLNRLTRVS